MFWSFGYPYERFRNGRIEVSVDGVIWFDPSEPVNLLGPDGEAEEDAE